MSKIDAAVAIITDNKFQYLLQKKDLGYPWFPGKWCLFGGGIESGENPLQAIERELHEEGIPFRDLKFFEESYYIDRSNGKTREGPVYVFHAKFRGKISDIRLGEGGGFGFFDRTELDSIPIVDYNRTLIERFDSSK